MGTNRVLIAVLGVVMVGLLVQRSAASAGAARPGISTQAIAVRLQAPTDQLPGRSVYENVCSRCHGANGRSDRAPVLVPFLWTYSQALEIIRNGGPCGMPAFRESELNDDELKQIVDYLKTFN